MVSLRIKVQRRTLMMNQKRIAVFTILLIFSLLLAGCNLPGQGAAPTLDPAALQATIDVALTQAMQTLEVDLTSTAAAMPTSTFTITPTLEPTLTSTPEPTATVQVPTATNTYIVPTKKPTATSTPYAYACTLLSTSPATDTKFNLNADFDAVWKVKNSGSKDWEIGYLDLKYVSGTKMQTVADIFDVSTFVAKDGELTLVVDMRAPSTAGKYTASWVLVMEGNTLCTLPVNIEAVTP